MAVQLYIRVRGRVQGPFGPEQLQGLARRGIFGRLHEVSEDGDNWVRASTYPGLFTSTDSRALAEVVRGDYPVENVDGRRSAPEAPDAASLAEWYYMVGSQQLGPVPQQRLVQLLESELAADTSVWTAGMPTWLPATQVRLPGLRSASMSAPVIQQHESTTRAVGQEKVSDAAYRALVQTRPWVLTMAIIMLLAAVSSAILYVMVFIAGAKTSSSLLVGQGIAGMGGSIVLGILAVLLMRYSSRIGALGYSHDLIHLEQALDAQRQYWFLTALVTISVIVISAVIALMAVAAI